MNYQILMLWCNRLPHVLQMYLLYLPKSFPRCELLIDFCSTSIYCLFIVFRLLVRYRISGFFLQWINNEVIILPIFRLVMFPIFLFLNFLLRSHYHNSIHRYLLINLYETFYFQCDLNLALCGIEQMHLFWESSLKLFTRPGRSAVLQRGVIFPTDVQIRGHWTNGAGIYSCIKQ